MKRQIPKRQVYLMLLLFSILTLNYLSNHQIGDENLNKSQSVDLGSESTETAPPVLDEGSKDTDIKDKNNSTTQKENCGPLPSEIEGLSTATFEKVELTITNASNLSLIETWKEKNKAVNEARWIVGIKKKNSDSNCQFFKKTDKTALISFIAEQNELNAQIELPSQPKESKKESDPNFAQVRDCQMAGALNSQRNKIAIQGGEQILDKNIEDDMSLLEFYSEKLKDLKLKSSDLTISRSHLEECFEKVAERILEDEMSKKNVKKIKTLATKSGNKNLKDTINDLFKDKGKEKIQEYAENEYGDKFNDLTDDVTKAKDLIEKGEDRIRSANTPREFFLGYKELDRGYRNLQLAKWNAEKFQREAFHKIPSKIGWIGPREDAYEYIMDAFSDEWDLLEEELSLNDIGGGLSSRYNQRLDYGGRHRDRMFDRFSMRDNDLFFKDDYDDRFRRSRFSRYDDYYDREFYDDYGLFSNRNSDRLMPRDLYNIRSRGGRGGVSPLSRGATQPYNYSNYQRGPITSHHPYTGIPNDPYYNRPYTGGGAPLTNYDPRRYYQNTNPNGVNTWNPLTTRYPINNTYLNDPNLRYGPNNTYRSQDYRYTTNSRLGSPMNTTTPYYNQQTPYNNYRGPYYKNTPRKI